VRLPVSTNAIKTVDHDGGLHTFLQILLLEAHPFIEEYPRLNQAALAKSIR
jgi:hypothetical protein